MLTFHASAIKLSTGAIADDSNTIGDFVRIMPDGGIYFQFVKHEMGQGIATAMAQIFSDELCADWERVKIEFPSADLKRYQNDANGGHDTGGSCTIIYQWDILRKAGATARQMLVEAAAKHWDVASSACYAQSHMVINRTTGKRIDFGKLAKLAAVMAIPAVVSLKEQTDFRIIGKPKTSKLIPGMVRGELKFGIDAKVPGMLYAVIARCPVFKGKLTSFDASQTLKIPGVKKVFSTQPIAGLQIHAPYMPYDIREGVVVAGDSFWAVKKGQEALKISWEEGINGTLSSQDFERMVEKRALHKTDPTGYVGDENAVSNVTHVRKTIRASYVFPHQLHSCMEPLNCTAHVTDKGCDVWLGTQAPHLIVSELNRVFKFPEDSIKVHLFPSGGGFGRRYYPDMAVEAAFISRELGNLPVKMIWTREDDHQANLGHLFQHLEYQVALDKENHLYAWYEKELRSYTWAAKYADPQIPAMAYDIPNIRFDFEDLIDDELVHSSAWRGVVGHGRFYSECFIDEIAAELKVDPYQFRLSLLKEGRDVFVGDIYPVSSSRIIRVLRLAAEKAGWGKKMEPGEGMGLAVCPYGNSYCGVVAEVAVNDNKLTIKKMTIGVDCGKVINPSGAANQIEGGIVWSLTALMYGGYPIKNGRATQRNFHENKLLRMDECPPIDVHFVPSQDERPWGIGEISSPLGVPAVLNAIFAATGKRIRKVPIGLEVVGSRFQV